MAPKADKAELLDEQIEEIEDLASDITATRTLGQSLASNPSKLNLFKAKLSRIDSTWEKFLSTAMKAKRVATQLEKTTELDHIVDLISQTRDAFYEALASEIPYEEGANDSLVNNSVPGASNNTVFKLPPISLPTFNGDISHWASYRDTYVSLIHENNNLSSIQKFHYLKSSLKGLALQSLSAIPITTETYLQAWDVLCKKYDNKRVQAANYLNNIFSYKPMSKVTLSALEQFSNTVLESSLAFKNLGLEDPAGFILISYALRLLDPKTREKFESEIGGEELVFTDFVNFMHKQCSIVQAEALTTGTRSHSPISAKPRTSRQVFMTTATSDETNKNICPLCKNLHRLYKCSKFLCMTPQQRFKEIKTRLLCVNCLASNHTTRTCRSTNTCRYCNHKHHSLLHFKQNNETPSSPRPHQAATNQDGIGSSKNHLPLTETLLQPVQDPAHGAVLSGLMKGDSLVLLGTAIARIKDLNGEFQTIRLLIDCGAQCSFITEACVKRLALRPQRNSQALSGFGNIPIEDGKFKVTCVLAPENIIYPQLQTEAVVVKEITALMPTSQVPRSVIDHFKEYKLADPGFWHPGHIDFLLGADLFGEILKDGSVITKKGYPNAIKSIFGWVITGKVDVPSQHHQINTMLTVTPSLNQLMEKFWKIEEVEVPIPANPEDNYCEEFFTNTHSRTDSGRYMVRLPFKNPSKLILGNSRTTALHRFHKLEARLLKSPTLKLEYSSVFNEYLEKNFMAPTSSENAYFLPHHGVFKESSTTNSENLPEIKTDSTLLCHTYPAKSSEDEWLNNVSSFSKTLRITAYILRYINNSKPNSVRRMGTLSLKEIHKATEICIKLNQKHFYHKELILITNGEGDKTQLSSVAPFLDSHGVLRVGGRLQNSPLTYEAKYPIILHHKSHFTTKLVDHFHKCYLHAGPQLLYSLIRRRYWIPSARNVIRSRIHQCITCHRLRVTNFMPFMSSLPASRFEQGRAFLNVGVDFAGPFLIKESTRKKAHTTKAYVCLYVCMSTKAVHLELVSQLTTDAFIACLERFVARRGVPTKIFSDNGTNFVGADRRLKELWNHFRNPGTQERITEHCNMKHIEWNFITPASPHFGGLWEAGIKSMKTHLVRVLYERILTFEELYTIISNIEAILNSRPLCPLSTSVDDIDALTPGHFLIGGPLVATQEPNLTDIPVNRLTRWQLVKRSIHDIWQRWRLEYLNSLQQRVKWRAHTKNVTAGTMVLVKEPRIPPRCWPAARIIETYPSKDGVVRIVKLKTPTGEYVRPVAQLAPLLPPSEV